MPLGLISIGALVGCCRRHVRDMFGPEHSRGHAASAGHAISIAPDGSFQASIIRPAILGLGLGRGRRQVAFVRSSPKYSFIVVAGAIVALGSCLFVFLGGRWAPLTQTETVLFRNRPMADCNSSSRGAIVRWRNGRLLIVLCLYAIVSSPDATIGSLDAIVRWRCNSSCG